MRATVQAAALHFIVDIRGRIVLHGLDSTRFILNDVLKESPDGMLAIGVNRSLRDDDDGMIVSKDDVANGGRHATSQYQSVDGCTFTKDAVINAFKGRG